MASDDHFFERRLTQSGTDRAPPEKEVRAGEYGRVMKALRLHELLPSGMTTNDTQWVTWVTCDRWPMSEALPSRRGRRYGGHGATGRLTKFPSRSQLAVDPV